MPRPHHTAARSLLAAAGIATALAAQPASADAPSPELRLSPNNRVPSCAAPERLLAFLRSRNDHLDPRYADIARYYREQGDAWRVRWDYAFFQMIVETNALTFRRGSGDPGDVKPRQNNFAGIGTTGGGVPGDSFADVRTGVAAHIQHLVAYSGEHLAEPIAPRTQLKQDDIIEESRRLGRPLRYADLARRWAVDRRYWQSIEAIASAFRAGHCTTAADLAPLPDAKPTTLAAAKTKAPAAALVAATDAGEPKMVREPTVARRPAIRTAGPVRTIWRAGDQAAPPQQRLQFAAAPVAPAQPQPSQPQRAAVATGAQGPRALAVPTATADRGVLAASAVAASPAALLQPATPPAAAPIAPPAASTDAAGQPPAAVDSPRKFAFAGSAAMHAGAPLPSAASAPASAATIRPSAAGSQPPLQASVAAGCSITSASYGGSKALLIRSEQDGRVRFTALNVLDGFEASMASNYIRSHAPGGASIGEFGSSSEALARAQELCRTTKVSDAR